MAHVVILMRVDIEIDVEIGIMTRISKTGLTDVTFQNPGEFIANLLRRSPRPNGVDDQLYRWTIAISDDSNEIIHKCPEMFQLILCPLGGRFPASIGGFVEITLTTMG
jgi:hypothetical protein